LVSGSLSSGRSRKSSGRNSRTRGRVFGSQKVCKEAQKVLKKHRANQRKNTVQKPKKSSASGSTKDDDVWMPGGYKLSKADFQKWLDKNKKEESRTNIDKLLNNENWQ